MTQKSFDILTRAFIALAALWTAACSDDAPAPEAPADSDGTFCFTLSPDRLAPESRAINYNGLNAEIENGTLVGCVIASLSADGSPAYLANSAWEYYPQGLHLAKLFDPDGNPLDLNDNGIIAHIEGDNHHLSLLNPDIDYAFYFYYPYIDEDVVTKKLSSAVSSGQSVNLTTLNYPNTGEGKDDWQAFANATSSVFTLYNNYMLNPSVAKNDVTGTDSKLKCSSWTKFPVAPMIDFRDDNDADKIERLNNSDFMYAAVTAFEGKAINVADTHSPIPVALRRQMVTIDLYFSEKPDDVFLKRGQTKDQWNNTIDAKMPRVRDFDLSTGKFTGYYEYKEWGATPIIKRAIYNSEIRPLYLGTADEWSASLQKTATFHIYRLIMAPQSASEFCCDLFFYINGKEEKLPNIQANPMLSSLVSGTYYKLRFTPSANDTRWHLVIEDWRKGDETILDRP